MAKFRLSVVERMREKAVQECLKELASTLASAQAAHHHCTELIAAASAESHATNAGDMELEAHYRARLREELQTALMTAAGCDAAVDSARNTWLKARAELEAVRTLHARHDAVESARQMRMEQRLTDEFANRRGIGVSR